MDPRIGSGDLVAPLTTLGVPASAGHLEFADVQVIGRGPAERPVIIGVEIKAVGDLLRCMTDERFVGHQLPGLRSTYEITYLLIEGAMTAANTRELMVLKGWGKERHWAPIGFGERTWVYNHIMRWLLTQENLGGVRPIFTADRNGTAEWIAALWGWWNEKAYEEHGGNKALYWKPLVPGESEVSAFDTPSEDEKYLMKVAAALMGGGVGYEKAKAAAKHFGSALEMAIASVEDWVQVEGFGKKLAAKMVEAVQKRRK